MKYKNFEDWFDERENYSSRSDRFIEEWDVGMDPARVIQWLNAAWECARMDDVRDKFESECG
jgi:hypothetical protein